QAPRQLQAVVALHDVGDAALAGLRVHADDGLVGAALVLGVDGQVRHLPRDVGDVLAAGGGLGPQGVEALVDGVLVRAGERGEHQVAAVRVPVVHGQLVGVLDGAADLVH